MHSLLAKIPLVRRPFYQRDVAREERDRAIAERDAAIKEYCALRSALEDRESYTAITSRPECDGGGSISPMHSGRPSAAVPTNTHLAPWLFVPPGHFYSPIPSLDDVRRDEQRIFPSVPRELPDFALNEARQLVMLDQLQPYYDSQPFNAEKTSNRRYFFENPMYSYSDAIFLHCMIRYARPRRIIEVGCGYSSCVTLDTNEIFFDNRIACTFIEPYPQRLYTLLREGDLQRIEILERGVQWIPLDRFRALEANDILFIDSTHVAKIGSDVNYIFCEILPALRPGVYVHFHDIFYPFEYPKEWIYEGRAYTEAYLLRAFLAFNSAYEIVLFNSFLQHFHRERFVRTMPLCLKNEGGNIWLRRSDN